MDRQEALALVLAAAIEHITDKADTLGAAELDNLQQAIDMVSLAETYLTGTEYAGSSWDKLDNLLESRNLSQEEIGVVHSLEMPAEELLNWDTLKHALVELFLGYHEGEDEFRICSLADLALFYVRASTMSHFLTKKEFQEVINSIELDREDRCSWAFDPNPDDLTRLCYPI